MAILLCHVNKKHPKQKSDYIVGSPQYASSFLLPYFYFRYKLYIIFKKIPCALQLRRAAFHTRYSIFYRSLNRSALYTPFSSIFRKLSFTAATSSW